LVRGRRENSERAMGYVVGRADPLPWCGAGSEVRELEAAMSSSDKHINTDMSAEAKRAFDEAAAALFEIFKDKLGRPEQHFINYDICVEDGEVRWRISEIDLWIRRGLASARPRVGE